ncbi:hypothetical protein IAF28_21130, partial [Acinetobacter baumannii]|nr:hypothetical protein [Acinetobacter baumannii]
MPEVLEDVEELEEEDESSTKSTKEVKLDDDDEEEESEGDDDDVGFDESSGKISAKESLEKRRLIDDLLAQRRLERELKDF